MDPRVEQALHEKLMNDVRKLIDSRFRIDTSTLSTDSTQALQQMNLAMGGLKSEIAKLNDHNSRLETELNVTKDALQRMKSASDTTKLESDIHDLKTWLNKVSNSVYDDTTRKEVVVLQTNMTSVLSRLREVEFHVDQAKTELTSVASKLIGLDLAGAPVGQNNLGAHMQTAIADLNLRIASLGEKIAESNATPPTISADIASLKTDVEDLKTSIPKINTVESGLEDQIKSVNKLTVSIETLVKVAAARTELEALSSRVSDIEKATSRTAPVFINGATQTTQTPSSTPMSNLLGGHQ